MAESYRGSITRHSPGQFPLHPYTEGIPGNYPSLAAIIKAGTYGADITPKRTKYKGMPALMETSDEANVDFFDRVKAFDPNGYIVGIGAGGILSLVDCFQNDNSPRGIIMTDINPYVVTVGKMMIDELNHAQAAGQFVHNFFQQSSDSFTQKFRKTTDADEELRDALERWEDTRLSFRTPMNAWANTQRLQTNHLLRRSTRIFVPDVIAENFQLLKSLADKEKMAVFFTDLTNRHFTQAVASLPDFSVSRNIIYLTNIIGFDQTKNDPDISLNNLKDFENTDMPPLFITAPTATANKFQLTHTLSDAITTHKFPQRKRG